MRMAKIVICIYLLLIVSLNLTLGLHMFRIIGGADTTIEEQPWAVSLQTGKKYGKHYCGGSIIAPNKVLTAAHCLHTTPLKRVNIVAGITNLNDTKSETRTFIRRALLHPQYSYGDAIDYDIAIITTKKRFKYSKRIKAIKLPENDDVLPVDTMVTISGWGTIDPDHKRATDILQSTHVHIMDLDQCRQKLKKWDPVNPRMFCAWWPEGGQDTCTADSGGPLEFNGTVYGVTSWGAGCGHPESPGVYTNVTYLRDWIRDNAGV